MSRKLADDSNGVSHLSLNKSPIRHLKSLLWVVWWLKVIIVPFLSQIEEERERAWQKSAVSFLNWLVNLVEQNVRPIYVLNVKY